MREKKTGGSRHHQSFRVCKVNLATVKVVIMVMKDHIAGKGINSLNHYHLVHKFFPNASSNENT